MTRTLALVLILAAPALAQEAALERNVGERAEDWFEWSRVQADRLLVQGRQFEAIEELSVCTAMRIPGDVTSPARLAVELVEYASTPPRELIKGGEYYAFVQGFIREGVARGGKGDPRLGYAIGRLYFTDQDWPHAHQMFKEAVARLERRDKPYEGIDLRRVQDYYYRAAVNAAPTIINAGRAQQVVEELGALLEKAPNGSFAPAARINLALAHRRLMDTVRAEELLRELTKEHPEYGEAWNAYGQVLQDLARNEEALAAYRQSLALATARGAPHAEQLALMAEVLLRLDRHDEAATAIQQFMRLDRDSAYGLYLLAKIRRGEGQTKEAIILLRRAKRLDPTLREVYTDLASLHYGRGELDEADAVLAELEASQKKLGEELDEAARQATGGDGEPAPKPDEPPKSGD